MWLGFPTNLKKVTEHSIDLLGSTVHESSSLRNLGVYFDPAVTLAEHISHICRISYFQLRNLRRVCRCISVHSASQLVHAFMTCNLDYCNSIFYNLPAVQVKLLQAVLKSAARLVTKSHSRHHMTRQLKSFHWLTYPHRITFNVCFLTYRCLILWLQNTSLLT